MTDEEVNRWADFWRYEAGMNVVPANTMQKLTYVKWGEWENKPIPEELHNEWKAQGAFSAGMAVMLGKVWHKQDLANYYFVGVDADNRKAIEEICSINNKFRSLHEFAQKTLVEQHKDDPNKAHFYFYTTRPIKGKSSDKQNNKLADKIAANEIPAIEIKSLGGQGLFFCSPSIHKDGCPYEIRGIKKPYKLDEELTNELEKHFESIFTRYDIPYGEGTAGKVLEPIEELFKPDVTIIEGHNRHEALLRAMESLIARNKKILSPDDIRSIASDWNIRHCLPPLDDIEFKKQWRCAVEFISKKQTEQELGRNDNNNEDYDYADQLIEDYTLKTLSDTEEIWYYDEEHGIFKPNAEPVIKARIEKDLGRPQKDKDGKVIPGVSTYAVNEYVDHIRRRTFIERDRLNPSIQWLACDNLMLNLQTGQTEPFSPKFMNTTNIPVEYKSYETIYRPAYRSNGAGCYADFFKLVECPCPAIMKFLHEIITPEDAELVLDFMAYCLWRSYKFNFWMLFNGAGQNGKSILLNLIERFFGKHNVSGETLDRLLHERFAVANLFQKMVNVDADVSADVIFTNTGIIKKLTGNDLHTGEFKYKKPFAFRNYAKLIFSCNKIPDTEDKTDAFFRRILIINFTQQFFGEKDDPDLIDKLCTEEEFSGLLYELLARLPRILKEGIRKVTNDTMAETFDKYTRGSDPVRYFVEKGLDFPIPECKVTKLDLLDHYERFCREFGLAVESARSLTQKLTEDHHLKVKRGRVNGELAYCWDGVRLKKWDEEEKKVLETLEDFSKSTKEAMK